MDARAGTVLHCVADQVGHDLLDRKPVPGTDQAFGQIQGERAACELHLGLVGGTDFTNDCGQVEFAAVGGPRLRIEPHRIEQQGGTLHIHIDDMSNAIEPRDEVSQLIAFGDGQGGRHLQQDRVHRIAQLMRSDGQKVIARGDLRLQLLDLCEQILCR